MPALPGAYPRDSRADTGRYDVFPSSKILDPHWSPSDSYVPGLQYTPQASLEWAGTPELNWEKLRKAAKDPRWIERDLYELALELKYSLTSGRLKEIALKIEGEYHILLSSGMLHSLLSVTQLC